MPNGVRHVLGLVAGVILAPAVAAGLFYGTERMARFFQIYLLHSGAQWVPLAVLTAVGVTLGVLAGSRISPLGSLVPGLLFTGVGGLWVVAPTWMARNSARKLPDSLERGYQIVGPYGLLLVLGLVLFVASLPPSRWRAREPRIAARHTYEYGTPDARLDRGAEQGAYIPPALQYGQNPQEGQPPTYRDQGPAFADPGPVQGQGPGSRPAANDPGPRGVPGSGTAPGSASGRPGPAPGYRSRENPDPPDWAAPPPGPPPFRP
ncbi:MAG: hypothetical protein QOE54_2296 [Streptosporangiaceae bacterium]|jgi:hypothetical protein|nr:hypothetical protein [Streptosporangiaceae bacterium]MDX6429930.1 hypothetical protein [Streptosporangiaceae bacterium]